jgi:hypothetical protein
MHSSNTINQAAPALPPAAGTPPFEDPAQVGAALDGTALVAPPAAGIPPIDNAGLAALIAALDDRVDVLEQARGGKIYIEDLQVIWLIEHCTLFPTLSEDSARHCVHRAWDPGRRRWCCVR